VAHQVKKIRPDLGRFHGVATVKERTSFRIERTRADGVNIVTRSVMRATPDQHDPDWPKYPETILTFSTTPKVEIDLRQSLSDTTLTELREIGFGSPFAVMTAFDPGGRDLPAAENENRRRDLNEQLKKAGYRFVEVDACSPDRSHCECSVAVVMPQDKAVAMAKELKQVAIFWFDGTRFWIVGALVETDALMLPRNS
jgi:hypothetical protein